jgi:hypothetical protein
MQNNRLVQMGVQDISITYAKQDCTMDLNRLSVGGPPSAQAWSQRLLGAFRYGFCSLLRWGDVHASMASKAQTRDAGHRLRRCWAAVPVIALLNCRV